MLFEIKDRLINTSKIEIVKKGMRFIPDLINPRNAYSLNIIFENNSIEEILFDTEKERDMFFHNIKNNRG